jgi:membrane protease YdiL (CAAX protease family)
MKRLSLADGRLDVLRMRELLTVEGIQSTIADDDNSLKALWVSDTDYLAAETFIRKLSSLPSSEPLPKSECAVVNPTDSASRSFNDDDDEGYSTTPPPQPEPVDTTSTRRACIGLVAATIAFLPLYSPLRLLYNLVVSWLHVRTFYEQIAVDILYQWVCAACVLLIIWWDGAPPGVFGLKRPAWSMDTVTACIAFAAHWTLGLIAVDLFVDFLHTLNYKIPMSRPIFRFSEPERGWAGVFLLLVLSVSIGLSEELAMRGYLIPRLERLLKSKLLAIVISSAFFGLWHLRRGIIAVWSAFWAGVIYGIVFVWTRRLWPSVFTHAAFDFVVFLSRA